MTARFWAAFSLTALLTAAVLASLGWLIGKLVAPAPPEKFVSSIFEFELPKGWHCQAEGTETVCHVGDPPVSAICVLAMKYRGPGDTFDAYLKHLSTPKQNKDTDGTLLPSEVQRVERRQIGGYRWVSALHYQSEIPRYFTEYYGTLTSHIAILVTFSVHRDHTNEHRKEFESMISSLKVYQGGFH